MIVSLDNASQRTKNRLREHNLVEQNKYVKPASKFNQTLFKCTNCDWLGWIPTNEFAVKE